MVHQSVGLLWPTHIRKGFKSTSGNRIENIVQLTNLKSHWWDFVTISLTKTSGSDILVMGVVRITREKGRRIYRNRNQVYQKIIRRKIRLSKKYMDNACFVCPVLNFSCLEFSNSLRGQSRQIVRGRLATGIVKNSHQIQPPSTSLDCNLTQSPSVIYWKLISWWL